jgi:hypothetical protein
MPSSADISIKRSVGRGLEFRPAVRGVATFGLRPTHENESRSKSGWRGMATWRMDSDVSLDFGRNCGAATRSGWQTYVVSGLGFILRFTLRRWDCGGKPRPIEQESRTRNYEGLREGGEWFSPIMNHGVSTKKFQGFSGRVESVFSRPRLGVSQEEV